MAIGVGILGWMKHFDCFVSVQGNTVWLVVMYFNAKRELVSCKHTLISSNEKREAGNPVSPLGSPA